RARAGSTCRFREEIDRSGFWPHSHFFLPVRSQTRWKKFRSSVNHGETHLVVGVSKQRHENVFEVVRPSSQHRSQSALFVMSVLLCIPSSKTLSHLSPDCRPYCRTRRAPALRSHTHRDLSPFCGRTRSGGANSAWLVPRAGPD